MYGVPPLMPDTGPVSVELSQDGPMRGSETFEDLDVAHLLDPEPVGSAQRAADAVRVMLVDDHRLLSESLAVSLAAEGLVCDVPALTSGAALLEEAARQRPELVLLDLDLGAAGHGLDLIHGLVALGCRVVVMSGQTDPEALATCLDRGAVGVVRKDVPFQHLVRTIVAAANGDEAISREEKLRLREAAHRLAARRAEALAPFDRLTEREADVLRMLRNGCTVRKIAEERVVSEATVRSQVHAVLTKLDVGSQLEAVALARRAGWR